MTAGQTNLWQVASRRDGSRDAERLLTIWKRGEVRLVMDALDAVMQRDGSVDADRVVAFMDAAGTLCRLSRGKAALSTTFMSLARRKFLLRDGKIKSHYPRNKGREINRYIAGRRWPAFTIEKVLA